MNLSYKFITPNYNDIPKFKNMIRILLPDDNFIYDFNSNKCCLDKEDLIFSPKPNFTYCEEIFEGMLKASKNKYTLEELNEFMYNMFYDSHNQIIYIILPNTHEHVKNMLFGYICKCQYCNYDDCYNSEIYFENGDELDILDCSEIGMILVDKINDILQIKNYDKFNGLYICPKNYEYIPDELKTCLINNDDLMPYKNPYIPNIYEYSYYRGDHGNKFRDIIKAIEISTNYKSAKKAFYENIIRIEGFNAIIYEDDESEDDESEDDIMYVGLDYLKCLKEYFNNYKYITHSSKLHPNHLKDLKQNYENINEKLENVKLKNEDINENSSQNLENKNKNIDENINDNINENIKQNLENENLKQLDYYSTIVILQYFRYFDTLQQPNLSTISLINLVKTCKKYENILDVYRTNLTSNYKIFGNISTYTFYTDIKYIKMRFTDMYKIEGTYNFPTVLQKFKHYNIETIKYKNLFYQLFRNNPKFHFKSIIYNKDKYTNKFKNKNKYFIDFNSITILNTITDKN